MDGAALLAFPVTLTFIALCGVVIMPFTAWIGLYRERIGVLRGDGGDPVLFKRIRIHGNFIENAPLAALTLAAAEGVGLGQIWLWAGVGAFIAGRIIHFALYDSKARGLGMLLTTLPPLAWGLWVLAALTLR